MNQVTWLTTHKTCDYLLVIQPHADLHQKIMQVKQNFAETYDCPTATHSKPHITLVSFKQYEMLEEKIVHRLHVIAEASAPFKVELKDFGSFPTHTIYLNVTTRVQIVNLVKKIRQLQKWMKMNDDNKPHFITEPHISIARKLQPWQYEKGWLEYSNTPFSGMFMADHILLLRKREGEWKYQPVQRFALADHHITIKQGDLFAVTTKPAKKKRQQKVSVG